MDVKDHLDICHQFAQHQMEQVTMGEGSVYHRSTALHRTHIYVVGFMTEQNASLLVMTEFSANKGSNAFSGLYTEEEIANSLALAHHCTTYKLITGASGHASSEKFVDEDRRKPAPGKVEQTGTEGGGEPG